MFGHGGFLDVQHRVPPHVHTNVCEFATSQSPIRQQGTGNFCKIGPDLVKQFAKHVPLTFCPFGLHWHDAPCQRKDATVID
jgi:hypothetical protein